MPRESSVQVRTDGVGRVRAAVARPTTPTPSYTTMDSPLGNLLLVGDTQGLHALWLPASRGRVDPHARWRRESGPFTEVVAQLEEYFAGRRTSFDVPLVVEGTPFQVAVWRALQAIPYATTVSYAEIARRIGRPSAVRAVGLANGQNPLSVLIPCHRVIGTNGSLTGYGGGLECKRWLLAHEAGRRQPVAD